MSLHTLDIPSHISPPAYCTPSRIVGERALAELLRRLPGPEGIRQVLDVGCGAGEYRFMFPGCGYTGIDIVDHQYAGKTGGGCRFALGSANALPVMASTQDLVLALYAFEYFPDPVRALREMCRVLRPGGRAICCLPTRWVLGYDLPANVLRSCGAEMGQVSAQAGVRYYTPRRFAAMAVDAGLGVSEIRPVYGWPILLLKAASSWGRVVAHLGTRLARRLAIGRSFQVAPLYVGRKITSARTRREWTDRLRAHSVGGPLYGRGLATLSGLAERVDGVLGGVPVVEYMALLTKPREVATR